MRLPAALNATIGGPTVTCNFKGAEMADTERTVSRTPVHVAGSIMSADGDELRVVAGKVNARSAERYLEFIVPSADLTVRASWKPRERAQAGDALPLALAINGSRPVDVIARAGNLYRQDARGNPAEPFEDARLRELGRVLLAIKLKNTPDFATLSPPTQGTVPAGATPMSFTAWTGCMADTAGAGAAVGGVAGGIAGGVTGGVAGGAAGAGTGAAICGVIAGTIGLGFCTTTEILGWLAR